MNTTAADVMRSLADRSITVSDITGYVISGSKKLDMTLYLRFLYEDHEERISLWISDKTTRKEAIGALKAL